jgi:tetratricopeptide (TPR) repeat protein
MLRKGGRIGSRGWSFALVALLTPWGLSGLEATEGPLRLEAHRPVERRIANGESQLYEVSVEQDEFIRLIVVHRGIDIDIEIACPGSAPQKTFGYGNFATTVSATIVERSGACRVALRAKDIGTAGSYRITLEKKRSPDAPDRLRAEAEKLIAGYDWNREKTAEERAQAIRLLESAVALWRQVGDQRGLAVDLTYLGFERFYSGKPKEALAAHEEALDLWRRLKDRAGQVVSSNAIGMASSYMASYARAIQSYGRAVELASQLPDPFEQARALSNMSIA